MQSRLRTLGAGVALAKVTHEVIVLEVSGGSDFVHQLLEEAILAAAPDVLRIEFRDADSPRGTLVSLPLIGEK